MLYSLSGLAYLVVYKLLNYRKRIVRENIANSFPEKSKEEQLDIEKKFYRYIADLLIETVWMFGVNEKRMRKRLKVLNPELLDPYFEQNRSVIVILGHYSCWEIVLSGLNLSVKHQCETIYVPLSDKEFDRQYLSMRTRFGSRMVSKKEFKNNIKQSSEPRAIIFGADQSPSISKNIHWMTFLNQQTAVATGAERYAKKYDLPVVYAHLYPQERGQFTVRFDLLTESPGNTAEGEITELHVNKLDEQIKAKPDYWLWSHRRWKLKHPKSSVSSSAPQGKEYYSELADSPAN